MAWTASDFERLDPRLFRSFLALVRTQSFSAAAEAAALTQSAVSQQIAKLEERLHAQLFVRSGTRVVTTAAGQLLSEYAQHYMDHANRFLEHLNEEFESLRGEVRYAMPESCIHAPHFGWLLDRRLEFPDITLAIHLKPSSQVVGDILAGDIDFGFINQPSTSTALTTHPFCQEEYVLVGSARPTEPLASPTSPDELLALSWVIYPEMIHSFNRWLAAKFPGATPLTPLSLKSSGEFNDIRGALAMVEGELGFTVLPRHVASAGIEARRLRVIDSPASAPARQQISIVRLADRRMPARVRRVIRWFLEMHPEQHPVPQEFLQ